MSSTNISIYDDPIIDKATAAQLAGRSESFIHLHATAVRLPLLPSERDGQRLVFRKSAVVKFMDELRAEQTARAAARIQARIARKQAAAIAATQSTGEVK